MRIGVIGAGGLGLYYGAVLERGGHDVHFLIRRDFDGSVDSSILIRTLLLQADQLRGHAGCGIVADSDPSAEASELGWKLHPLLEALE